MTPQMFAEALLHRLGMPVTDNNVAALVAVQVIEGGHSNNSALYNPMNTMWDLGGSRDAGLLVHGIKAYNSWDEGLEATALTLIKGPPAFKYGPILDALRHSAPPDETLKAWGASKWGWSAPVAAAKAYISHAKDEFPAKGGPTEFLRLLPFSFSPQMKTVFAAGAIGIGLGLVVLAIAGRRKSQRGGFRVLRRA